MGVQKGIQIMATSSITANFRCDEPKAANRLVRLLAESVPSTARGVRRGVRRESPAQRQAFFEGLKTRYCKASSET